MRKHKILNKIIKNLILFKVFILNFLLFLVRLGDLKKEDSDETFSEALLEVSFESSEVSLQSSLNSSVNLLEKHSFFGKKYQFRTFALKEEEVEFVSKLEFPIGNLYFFNDFLINLTKFIIFHYFYEKNHIFFTLIVG